MTRPVLNPLSAQTLVITGASSGHGLSTALKAAAVGASVVLVARNEASLSEAVDRITRAGGRAAYVVADVCDESAVQSVVDRAVSAFGGFDTWVNNAGVGIYGALRETPTADHKRLFETNYWGVVHGSLAAVRHLETRPGGGAIVNVGSIQSDMASPVLGAYNASKHAVKGFTDSLRIELIRSGTPVSVTLIKPSATGTPFPQHGRNLTGYAARLPRPLYAPELVADAILHAAQHPRRAITVGAVGRAQVLAANALPSLFDRLAGLMVPALIDTGRPINRFDGNLDAPVGDGTLRTEGDQRGRGFSVYTAAQTHPKLAAGTLLFASFTLAAWLSSRILAWRARPTTRRR